MPLTSTQALNGLSDGPVLRMIGCSLSRMNSLAAQDRAAQGAALAVDVLGRGVHDDVGAELERPLQHRRGEGVVEHDLGAGLVREVAHRLDVDDVEHRVGRRFEQHGLAGVDSAFSHCARSPPSTNSPWMPYFGSRSFTM